MRNLCPSSLLPRVSMRDSRDELYASLLGKSQTFHGRQRIGDIMARPPTTVRMLNIMFQPGVMRSPIRAGRSTAIIWSPARARLLLVHASSCPPGRNPDRLYRRLNPVSIALREQFGNMNAGLAEAIAGHEVSRVTP